MKKSALISILLTIFLANMAFCKDAKMPNIYENKLFGFKFVVPETWRLHGEEKFNKKYSCAIVDYGLPLTWSDKENQEIENAVTVVAYMRPDIANIDELVSFEKRRIKQILVSMEEVSVEKRTAFLIITKINGLEYKTQSSFIYKNNCGYIISFTATHGTYDKNLSLYHEFLNGVEFFEPEMKYTVLRKE